MQSLQHQVGTADTMSTVCHVSVPDLAGQVGWACIQSCMVLLRLPCSSTDIQLQLSESSLIYVVVLWSRYVVCGKSNCARRRGSEQGSEQGRCHLTFAGPRCLLRSPASHIHIAPTSHPSHPHPRPHPHRPDRMVLSCHHTSTRVRASTYRHPWLACHI